MPEVSNDTAKSLESEIAAMLEAKYGDGLMYQPRINKRSLYKKAIDLGFLDADGYLTRKGRSLLTQYRFHH